MERAADDRVGARAVPQNADSRSGEGDLGSAETRLKKEALPQVIIETDGVGYNIRQQCKTGFWKSPYKIRYPYNKAYNSFRAGSPKAAHKA